MEVSAVTGAVPRDYIELRAETTTECAALLELSQSKFVPQGTVELMPGYKRDGRTVYLRILFGEVKQPITPQQILAALDATP